VGTALYRHDLTGRGNYGWKADGLLGTLYINCAALNAKKSKQIPSQQSGIAGLYRHRRRCTRREIVMIRSCNGMLAAVGLLIGVLPTAALAQLEATAARRAACMGDAIMLCSSAIPNKARIAACLASKMEQLTPRCRAQFAKR